MNSKDLASIIIPTIKRVDLVKKCVSSLISITKEIDYEIIVIDDGSSQQEKRKLQQLAKKYNFSLILKTHNTGFAKTVNYGIKAARGNFLVLVNNDIIFTQASWLKKLVHTAKLDPQIGVVGCRLLYPNNRIQHAGISYYQKENWLKHDHRAAPADFPPAVKTKPIGFVTGAVMLIKRETIEQIGLLDESYFVACEDVDYCLRAREAGWLVMYCGEAKAIHLEGATRGNTPENKVPEWYQKELTGIKKFFQNITTPPVKKPITQPNSSDNQPQIVYVLPFLGISAGVKSVLEQANRLAERGYRVAIYSLNAQLDWFNLKVPLHSYQNYEKMFNTLKKLNCLKIATWWETAPLVYESCDSEKGGQGRCAYFVQDMEDKFYPRSPKIQHQVQATYRLPMLYFTGSAWVQRQLEEKYQKPAVNISSAIDLNIFQPQKRIVDYDCRRSMAYSKTDHLKKPQIIEKALAMVAKDLKYISLITFGPEPVKFTSIPHLHFSKFDDAQLAYLYNSAGLFIHYSQHEDFGLPLLEAMACGTPVIATKANGNLEFCQDGHNCLLTSTNDSRELANKIKLILTEHSFAQYLTANGIKTAQKYNWATTIDNLEKLLGI